LLLGLLGLSPVLQADSSTTPFLRIETGMHTAPIMRIDVDAKERYLVTASHDKTVRVWDLTSGKLLQVLRPPIGPGNEGRLNAVASSPDGETVAVGGMIGPAVDEMNIYLFDRNSGRLQGRIAGLPDVIPHLAYSTDGRYLAAALGAGGIRIYRSRDGVEVDRDTNYGGSSYWVEFDRAGRLVSTCLDGYIRLYDADFKLLGKRQAPGGKQPFAARFSPAGDTIAVGFYDSTAVNVLSGKDLSFLYAPTTQGVDHGNLATVAWSQDGQWLYAGGSYQDKSGSLPILKWPQAGRGDYMAWPVSTDMIGSLRALAHGRLVFGAADPVFGILDRTGRKLLEQGPGIVDHRGNQDKLRVSPDGRLVQFSFDTLTPQGTWQQRLARWDLGQRRLTFPAELSGANRVTLSPPRTAAPGLTITDWYNTMKPRLNGQILQLKPYEMSRSLAITPDGKHFLLGTEWFLRLFDRQGRQQWQVPVPGVAWAVNVSDDGKPAVAAFGDGTLRWYRLTDGRELMAFFPHADSRRWVLWTQEGFFDAKGGGEKLIGYHLNQGPDQAGEFVKVDQLYDLFYRPDLVARSLTDEGERAIQAEVARIGDVRKVLAGGLPPELELVSSRQEGLNLLLEFKAKDRGGGVGKIVYRINGVEQEARPVAVGLPGHAPIRVSLPLPEGRSTVAVSAYNKNNTIESRSIETTPNIDISALARPSLYILALGASSYRDPSMALKYAAEDARALASELERRGQGLFQSIHMQPLLDREVTLQKINTAFTQLADQVKENDVFVLYMAGHGIVLSGAYHFIPADAIYRNEQALRKASLDEQRLRDLLKKIRAQKSLIILDTCYAGAASKLASLTTAATARGDLSEKTAITKLMRATGRAVLAASSDKQLALEGHQGHGFFTFALLQGLKGQADLNKNGEISTLELAEFVSHEVPKITRDRQFPIHESQGLPFPIGIAR
jgi:WD40 repeat protein